MTLDDVRVYGRAAYQPLPDGTFLRYQPEDGTIREVGGRSCRHEVSHEEAPQAGWRHLPTCCCERCRPDGGNLA
jgi:hypothetical protein